MIGRQQESGIQGERVAQPQPRGEAVRGVQGVVSSCAGGALGGIQEDRKRWCGAEHGVGIRQPLLTMSSQLPHSHVTLGLGCQTSIFGAQSLLCCFPSP